MGQARHVLVLTVDNKPGVLSRITGLFTRRGYNIESLITGPTDTPEVYHITVTMTGSEEEAALLSRQLARVMEVITIRTDLDPSRLYARSERLLLKLRLPPGGASSISLPAGARLLGTGRETAAVEVTGDPATLTAATAALAPLGILETLYSGAMILDVE